MPTATTTVTRFKTRPFRVTATDALGNPRPPSATLGASSSDNFIATLTVDPANGRRYFIGGSNVGTATITVGSGPNSLTIEVTVLEVTVDPDQVNRVDLEAFEDEA